MSQGVDTLVFLFLLVAGMYFLIIRPNQARQKQMRELAESLKPGMRVMTAGGIWGTLVRVSDETVEIEIASGVTIELEKGAVARVAENEDADA